MHFVYVTRLRVEEKRIYCVIERHYRHRSWYSELQSAAVHASLSATLHAPLFPLPFISNGRRTYRFAPITVLRHGISDAGKCVFIFARGTVDWLQQWKWTILENVKTVGIIAPMENISIFKKRFVRVCVPLKSRRLFRSFYWSCDKWELTCPFTCMLGDGFITCRRHFYLMFALCCSRMTEVTINNSSPLEYSPSLLNLTHPVTSLLFRFNLIQSFHLCLGVSSCPFRFETKIL